VRRVIAASADGQPARDKARQLVAELTERETEVLACLGEGLSNAQIAARLYLSEATVKGYVSRMLDKLGVASRTQPSLLAHDAGLLARPKRDLAATHWQMTRWATPRVSTASSAGEDTVQHPAPGYAGRRRPRSSTAGR
jgi:DNA-binding CsgD family transcriptional regulator